MITMVMVTAAQNAIQVPTLSQDRTWDSHQNELTLDLGYFRFRNTGLLRKLRP